MEMQDILLAILLIPALFLAVWKRKLTPWGTIIAGWIGLFTYIGMGLAGIGMLITFFVLGTLATLWGRRVKKKIGLDDNHGGQRTAGQVIANGGVACILAVMAGEMHQQEMFSIMMAAAVSSAIADTLASELGTLYGKRFYNILTFRKDTRGENGVVSIEGTLIGIAGSCIIAAIYGLGFNWAPFWIIVVSGTAGNIADSILGATLERKGIIKNNAVNLLNTMIAALTAYLFYQF
jgi:uncharacterized protein (TIGR00297 family)